MPQTNNVLLVRRDRDFSSFSFTRGAMNTEASEWTSIIEQKLQISLFTKFIYITNDFGTVRFHAGQ